MRDTVIFLCRDHPVVERRVVLSRRTCDPAIRKFVNGKPEEFDGKISLAAIRAGH